MRNLKLRKQKLQKVLLRDSEASCGCEPKAACVASAAWISWKWRRSRRSEAKYWLQPRRQHSSRPPLPPVVAAGCGWHSRSALRVRSSAGDAQPEAHSHSRSPAAAASNQNVNQ